MLVSASRKITPADTVAPKLSEHRKITHATKQKKKSSDSKEG